MDSMSETEYVPCTCTYGWSETARRVALLTFDPECRHCLQFSYFGIKEPADDHR